MLPASGFSRRAFRRGPGHCIVPTGFELRSVSSPGQVAELTMGEVSDTEPELDLIAVGAHPDDVEIACGGTLARLVRKGYRVGIVDLTDGEPTPGSPGPEVRLAEAERAAE